MQSDGWRAEVDLRLGLSENAAKVVQVSYAHQDGKCGVTIKDQGKGFDWRKFLQFDPDRAFDTHGRGIAMSRMLSFDKVEYEGDGSEVTAVVDGA